MKITPTVVSYMQNNMKVMEQLYITHQMIAKWVVSNLNNIAI